MSLSVPTGTKPRSDAELAQLATSPTWTQSPNGWFDRSAHEEDDTATSTHASASLDGQFDQPDFLDDVEDALPLSMELRGSDLETSDLIPAHYWDRIFTTDERARKAAMSVICRALRSSLQSTSSVFEHSIPRLVRLLSECPYQDIHDSIHELLTMVQKELGVHGIAMPAVPRPSRMFKESVVPLVTEREPAATLFKASWLNTGRVTHLSRILAWHPAFLEKFTETTDFLLRADGPLPFPYRHYLALLSASRFKSNYIVQQQKQEFLLAGGDETWLETTKNCPPKLQRILEVNAILAHQPWRLQPQHIADLLKSGDSASRWSAGELVHAFVIMATFRALAGLAIGMGLNPEIDINIDTDVSDQYHSRLRSNSGNTALNSSNNTNDGGDADKDGETVQLLTSRLATRSGSDDTAKGDAEQRKQQFEEAGEGENLSLNSSANSSGAVSSSPGSSSASLLSNQTNNASGANLVTASLSSAVAGANSNASTFSSASAGLASPPSSMSPIPFQRDGDEDPFARYTEPYPVKHTDFDVRSRDYSVFHIQDWSWEEQAYELLERTYDRDFANLIDTEFTTIFELTYHQVNGQQGVDTAPFRRSIWYYVHRIHGILHDDYNYATVNELLLRNLKKFTKDVACTPFLVTPQDLVNLGYSLSPEEKCHIALLATEARKQAELMYALYALSRHLAQSL